MEIPFEVANKINLFLFSMHSFTFLGAIFAHSDLFDAIASLDYGCIVQYSHMQSAEIGMDSSVDGFVY